LRKRALVDLLKALKSSGLSYLSAAVDSALTSPTQLVQSQSLWNSLRVFEGSIDTAALLKPDFAQFAALADSFSGSVHEISQSLCAKSERYFFENQAMLRKLRERFTKFSSDLSRLEAIKSKYV
jgi:hypothetical protein